MIAESLKPSMPVSSSLESRDGREAIRLWNPKRKLRHLYLVKATAPYEDFVESGQKLVDELRENPMMGYPEFSDDLEARLGVPYEMPNVSGLSDLPESAKPFTLVTESGHERVIPDFPSVLRRKIASRFPWNEMKNRGMGVAFDKSHEEELFDLLEDVASDDKDGFEDCLMLYNFVSPELLQLIGESIDRIKQLPPVGYEPKKQHFVQKLMRRQQPIPNGHSDPEVYHGRDGRYLYIARKSGLVGKSLKPELSYVVSSRAILGDPKYEQYIEDAALPEGAYHIDTWATNFQGARRVMALLGEDTSLTEEQLQKRLKAIVSNPETSLFPERDVNELVEQVSRLIEHNLPYNMPDFFERDNAKGKLQIPISERWVFMDPVWAEIRIWSLEQAIKRHFLPKKEEM